MATQSKTSFFLTTAQILVGLVAFVFILCVGQKIILPLIFGFLLATLTNPLVTWLENHKIHRVLAISLTVLLTFVTMIGVLYFLASQVANLTDAMPGLETKFDELTKGFVSWVSEHTHINTKNLNQWIAKLKKENMGDGSIWIGRTIATMTGILLYLFLLPVYIFLFLYYKPLLLEFIAQLFPSNQYETIADVLTKTKKLIQNYLVGLCFEAGIVCVLISIALLILGIDYAILLGIIGAMLNVIPYIGGITSALLPMILALVTKEPVYAIYVLIAFGIIQFIDNNILVPKIVASQVKVNALISIIAVFIGGAIWGVAGMFVSLPMVAIIKVIFDAIEPMKPWGFLIGDTMPESQSTIFNFIKKRRVKKV